MALECADGHGQRAVALVAGEGTIQGAAGLTQSLPYPTLTGWHHTGGSWNEDFVSEQHAVTAFHHALRVGVRRDMFAAAAARTSRVARVSWQGAQWQAESDSSMVPVHSAVLVQGGWTCRASS